MRNSVLRFGKLIYVRNSRRFLILESYFTMIPQIIVYLPDSPWLNFCTLLKKHNKLYATNIEHPRGIHSAKGEEEM